MMLRLLLFALIALGLGGFGAVAWMASPRPAAAEAPPPPAKAAVLAAARTLHPGTLIKPEDLAARELEPDKLPPGSTPDGAEARRALAGGMVRRVLAPGDVLLPADVLRPGDHGFLAAVLRPGTRAVTVAVDAVSGAAGLIWPGDRVDLILTQALEAASAPGRRVLAETVLRDVRVIAIDQQLVRAAPGAAEQPARTVTLEVSSASAEHVQVATRLGRLSLALRAAEQGPAPDRAGETRAGGTWAGDVSGALAATAADPAPHTVRVYQGSSDGKEFRF